MEYTEEEVTKIAMKKLGLCQKCVSKLTTQDLVCILLNRFGANFNDEAE